MSWLLWLGLLYDLPSLMAAASHVNTPELKQDMTYC